MIPTRSPASTISAALLAAASLKPNWNQSKDAGKRKISAALLAAASLKPANLRPHGRIISNHLRGITCRGLIEATSRTRASAPPSYLRGITCRGLIEASEDPRSARRPAPISAALLAAASLKLGVLLPIYLGVSSSPRHYLPRPH